MSDGEFQPLTWLRAVLDPDCTLDPYEALVMLALVKFADNASGKAWPGFTGLTRATRVSRTKLILALDELERRGCFVREVQKRGQAFGSNVYQLAYPPPTSALHALPPARPTRQRSAPHALGSAPHVLGVVRQADGGSAPHAPYLPIELLNGTAQGTAGVQTSAPDALPAKPTKARERTRASKPTETTLPHDWKPTEAHQCFAKDHGLDVGLEVIGFRGHYEGKKALSWNGRFTTWLANQAKWNKQRGPRRVPAPQRGVANEAEAQSWGKNGALLRSIRGAE